MQIHWLFVADTSNVSIGDLENILETETPPQSPTSDSQQSGGETVTISMTSPTGTTVQYHKHGDDDVETDTDSLDHSPKAVSPMSKVITPLGRSQSPPRPSSPTDVGADPQLPVLTLAQPPLTSKPHPSHKVPSRKVPKCPPRVSSPTEAVAQFSREQPRRIAEYNRNSFGETEECPIILQATPAKAPLVRQRTEPALKYNAYQQVEPLYGIRHAAAVVVVMGMMWPWDDLDLWSYSPPLALANDLACFALSADTIIFNG